MGPDKTIIGLITWKFIQAIFLDKFKFSFLFYTKLFPLCTNKKKQKRLPTAWSQANAKNKIEWELWFPGKGIFMHSWLFYFNFGFLNNIKKNENFGSLSDIESKFSFFVFFLFEPRCNPTMVVFAVKVTQKLFFTFGSEEKKGWDQSSPVLFKHTTLPTYHLSKKVLRFSRQK